jgi:ABC-2 type transport system permease protein
MNYKEMFIAIKGSMGKECRRIFRIWPQSLLPSPIMIMLYFIICGNILGPNVHFIEGINYIRYITPGLILMPVISTSYANVVGSFFSSKFNRSIEEMLVSPMSNWMIILSYISGGICRGLTNGCIIIVITYILTKCVITHIFLTILVILLASTLFSLGGLINGIHAKKFDDLSIITMFILTPLIYLGGVFYDISTLNSPWKEISLLNPIYYIIKLFRYTVLGIGDINCIIFILLIIVLIILLFAYCLYCFRKGIGIKT